MLTLTVEKLCSEARLFSIFESGHREPSLFGVTDGKSVGNYLEQKFSAHLKKQGYHFTSGNSASGIDFPDLLVDVKVTSIRQPQSSCPFKSARQKIYGLGYSLLIFIYQKYDDETNRTSTLKITDAIFIHESQTADFQMTKGLRDILSNEGNLDDIMAYMAEKNLPIDELELQALATEIQKNPPKQGYLTISNALQWRLQYTRAIEKAGTVDGVRAIHRGDDI